MPSAAEIRAALARQLSPGRAAHSERVAATAAQLAGLHGCDAAAAELAGLLHDWYREVPAPEIVAMARDLGIPAGAAAAPVVPSVLHGPVAARLLPRRWPEIPPAVLAAIDRHTTGDPEMTLFDALLYVADLTEPAHTFGGVAELRALAARDLWAAALAGMDAGITRLIARRRAIDPRTVAARNALLARPASGGGTDLAGGVTRTRR